MDHASDAGVSPYVPADEDGAVLDLSGDYQELDVSGSGGKSGGSGRVAQEAKNTLHARQTARVIDALGEGEIVGLVNGDQSIFFDGTPLRSPGGAQLNYKGITWDSRVGLNDQAHMADYPTAESTIPVGVEVKFGIPVIRTVSDPTVDAIRVTIEVPSLTNQNTTNGDLNGSEVTMRIVVRDKTNAIIQDVDNRIGGKTTQNYQRAIHLVVNKGGNPWTVELHRYTPDATTIAVQNKSYFHSYSTIVSAKLRYPGVALVALTADAKEFGSSIPQRNYLVDGLKIKYPSNWDPATRQYSGIWNGTFSYGFCNNPAWVLYDILTRNYRAQGPLVPESRVDKWSFYVAGQYADQQVPNGFGGNETRFIFNGCISQAEEAFHLVQAVASCFRGIVYWAAGKVFVRADMPETPKKNVVPGNVIGGLFTYSGTSKFARHTVAHVSWNDPNDEYKTAVEVVTDPDAILRFGWKETSVTAVGCTSRGQAARFGRWILDSEQYETETVTYTCSMDHATVVPGDIIKISDPHYAGVRFGGRVVSLAGSTITLDAPVELASGHTYSISVTKADGTLQDIAITSPAGTHTTLSLASAALTEPNAVWLITGTDVNPRLFRVLGVREVEKHLFEVIALFHDPNKYSRVEFGLKLDAPPYQRIDNNVGPPTGVVFTEESVNDGLRIRRRLRVSWTPPTTKYTSSYKFRWAFQGGNYVQVEPCYVPEFTIEDVQPGTYDVLIATRNVFDRESIDTAASYSLSLSGASPLPAVTGLAVKGGGTTWSGRDMQVQWTAVASTSSAQVRDYHVTIKDSVSDAILRVFTTDTNGFVYYYDWNQADGGPRRALKVEVRVRDTFDRLSGAAVATLTNVVPALPTAVSLTGGFRFVTMKFTPPADNDYAGVMVWWSETSGFTPGPTNLAADDKASPLTMMGEAGKVYYVRYAAYDDFGKTGLTVSGELSVSTVLIQHADLANEIIETSNLIPALNTQIAKIPVIETAVTTETTARETADTALAQQITTISATASTGFNAAAAWHYETGNDNWTATNCTTAWQSSGALRVTPTAADHYIASPTVSINGAQNRFIRIKLTRVSGSTSTGNHQVYFTTSGHSYTETHSKTIAVSAMAVGESRVLSFDMQAAGDWATSTITRIRFDPLNVTGNVYDIDWITVGSEAPGVGTAILQEVKQALVDADTAIASSVTTLQTTVNGNTASIQVQGESIGGLEAQYTVKTDVNGYVSGYGLATTVRNGVPTSSFVVSADRFAIAAVGATALNPTIPFVVTTKGANAILSFNGYARISNLLTGNLETERLFVGPNTGTAGQAYVVIDGPAAALRVNNGTRDVINMGKRSDGTYGLDLKRDDGTVVFSTQTGFGAGVVGSANLSAGTPSNLLYNSDAQISTDGWQIHSRNTSGVPTMGRNLDAGNIIPGTGLLWWQVTGSVSGNVFDIANVGPNGYANRYAVKQGQRYEASGYAGVWRATKVNVYIQWFNAAGAAISESHDLTGVTNQGGFVRLNQLGRTFVFGTAPTGAVTALVGFRVTCNATANPVGMVTQAYFGEATANQAEVSFWVPGPTQLPATGVGGLGPLATTVDMNSARNTLGLGSLATLSTVDWSTVSGKTGFAALSQLTKANASTYIANAALNSAHIETLTADRLASGTILASTNINVSNSIRILGDPGAIQVLDPRFSPARERVYIGHRPLDDFGFYLWDSNGNNIFNSSGLNGTFIRDLTVTNGKFADLTIGGEKIQDLAASNSVGGISPSSTSYGVGMNVLGNRSITVIAVIRFQLNGFSPPSNNTAAQYSNDRVDFQIVSNGVSLTGWVPAGTIYGSNWAGTATLMHTFTPGGAPHSRNFFIQATRAVQCNIWAIENRK